MPIKLIDVVRYFRDLPHQKLAIATLEAALDPRLLEDEALWVQQYRNQVPPLEHKWAAPLIAAVPNDRVPNGKTRRENAGVAIPLLLATCEELGVINPTHIAYIMGTVNHESYFAPINELGNIARFTQLYEGRSDLGNSERGDGARFKGRGYVQITGRRNYRLFSRLLNIDLVGKPELALVPETAARICVLGMKDGLFTGAKLSHYDKPHNGFDWINARRIVNGLDRANLIASYAQHYFRAIAS
ncbi:MAG: hypothetical protein DDT26_00768 [Dehalococcoidia bacterium]|nr:hypothetical protein [Chloroflexota bacterium]